MGRLFAIDKMAERAVRNTESRLKRRWALTRCTRTLYNPAARLSLKTMPTRWVKRISSVCRNHLPSRSSASTTGPKHALLNAIAQPERFVEVAKRRISSGIAHGDTVVSSNRGYIRKPKAVVTKHIRAESGRRTSEAIGIPYSHRGYEGVAKLYRQYVNAWSVMRTRKRRV